MENNWTTTVWGVLLLTVVGGAIFEWVVKPTLGKLGLSTGALFRALAGRASDRRYRDAAQLGQPFTTLHLLSLPILALIALVIFGYLYAHFPQPAQVKGAVEAAGIGRQSFAVALDVIILLLGGALVVEMWGRLRNALGVAAIVHNFNRTLDYLRPHIEADDEFQLRQSFSAMTGRQDMRVIDARCLALAEAAGIQIPWQDDLRW